MFAVIKTGGKQYKVAANDILKVEKLESQAGDVVTFEQVLMVGNGDDVTVGAPLVEGALVAGHLLETRKSDTVIIFKKRRRHNSRRRNGHRQLLSTVRITEILTGGAAVTTQPDERIKARYAETHQADVAAVTEPAPAGEAAEKPARKTARAKTEAPAEDHADQDQSAEDQSASTTETAGESKPAKPRAKKTAPKADQE